MDLFEIKLSMIHIFQDCKCLQKIRKEFPDHWIDKTLYVVTAKSFSGSLRHFHTLSHEIGMELDLNINNITYRIFKDKDEHILERMSLYFDYKLLESQSDVYRYLQSLGDGFQDALRHTESSEFSKTLRRILLNGPLGLSLPDILRDASRSYIWTGASFTRDIFIEREATYRIVRFACEQLGRDIVETIIDHLTVERSGNHNVSNILLRYIDLNDFEPSILKKILVLLLFVLVPFAWIIGGIILLFRGTDINSIAFRDEVALKIQNQIRKNTDKIIQAVIEQFCSEAIPIFEELQMAINNSDIKLRRMFSKTEYLIKKDMIEHEFRTVAGKYVKGYYYYVSFCIRH